MKTKNYRIGLLILVLLILSIISGYSQNCESNKIALNIQNIKVVTTNTIEFDVYVNNIGSTTLTLAAIQGAVIHDARMIAAEATTTFSVVTQPTSTGNFPEFNSLGTAYAADSKQLRWSNNPVALLSGKTVNLPRGKSLQFARFRLTSSLPMETSLASSLKLQLDVQRGYTNALATVYCNENTNAINLRPVSTTLSEMSEEFSVKAIPNPFTDEFNLHLNTVHPSDINVKVYNMLGKLIDNQTVLFDSIARIQLGSNFPSGIYNVVITQNENTQTLKIIKR
jgi:Secretion system C-terminal sorting domain